MGMLGKLANPADPLPCHHRCMGFLDRFRRSAAPIELDDQQQRIIAQLRDSVDPGDVRPSGNSRVERKQLREIIDAFEARRMQWENPDSRFHVQARLPDGRIVEWTRVADSPEHSEPFLIALNRYERVKTDLADVPFLGMSGVISTLEKVGPRARVMVLDQDQRAQLHSFLHIDHEVDAPEHRAVGLSDLDAPASSSPSDLPDGPEADLSL